MKPAVVVGNDVVDLSNPRTFERSGDERFVRRVYADSERDVIAASAEPDLELWCLWAAKEAAFKVVSKLLGEPPPFVHRAFVVRWVAASPSRPDAERTVRRGTVVYEPPGSAASADGIEIPVNVDRFTGAIHALAYGPRRPVARPVALLPTLERLLAEDRPWRGTLEELTPRFTERELDAVYSQQSAAVRLGARHELSKLLAIDEARIEIVCTPGPTSQRPPHVLVDGEPVQADVSLSHDGPWIAWALWHDPGEA